MARQPCLEYPGALYLLTAQGNELPLIFHDDNDRYHFLWRFGQEILQQGRRYAVYCLMDTHFRERMAGLLPDQRPANVPFAQPDPMRLDPGGILSCVAAGSEISAVTMAFCKVKRCPLFRDGRGNIATVGAKGVPR